MTSIVEFLATTLLPLNGSSITGHSYAFDGLGRATNAVRSVQPLSLASTNIYAYNARSEVIGAGIETNDYAYFYDNIGNNLFTLLNAITNAYTVNNLNQYKAVTNLLDFSGYRLGHDSDGNTTLIDDHYLSYDPENRLSAYTFGLGYATGTLRSAYVYDYLGRRVKKLNQENMVKNPGGFIPLTYWHTNEMTTFVYDGWNLVHERESLTNGTTQEVSYFWGKDMSGTLQGAGGVGGLLAASIDGDFYFPCYDNNGNITAYIDESGSVIAYRHFDAFGNTVSKGGDMVDTLHFWYSTKYLDHDTGLYYYGYRYYSPKLQRWINRDPVEESGGLNLYAFCENTPVTKIELLGMLAWKWKDVDEGPREPEIQSDGRIFGGLTHGLTWKVNNEVERDGWLSSCYIITIKPQGSIKFWWSKVGPTGKLKLTPLQHELSHVRQYWKQWVALEKDVEKIPRSRMKKTKANCYNDVITNLEKARRLLASSMAKTFDLENGQTKTGEGTDLLAARNKDRNDANRYFTDAALAKAKCAHMK